MRKITVEKDHSQSNNDSSKKRIKNDWRSISSVATIDFVHKTSHFDFVSEWTEFLSSTILFFSVIGVECE